MGLSCLLAIGAATSPAARAAHPLQTEDTGTQGTNNVEWENGFSQSWSAGRKVFVFQPQFSLGVSPTLDLIVQPAWVRDSNAGGAATEQGLGDTNLDAKWRFHGQGPLSLAVRAGFEFATSRNGLGLSRGTSGAHATLVGTFDAAPLVFHANLGVVHNPEHSGLRRTATAASGAAMWAKNEKLTLTVEAVWSANTDPAGSGHIATTLAGLIYTVKPGLDVDLGCQHMRGGVASGNALLVGLTYRFGL